MEKVKIKRIQPHTYNIFFGMEMVGYGVIIEEMNGSGLYRDTVLNFNSFDGSNISARVINQKIVFTFDNKNLRVDQLSVGEVYDVEVHRSEQISDTIYLTLRSKTKPEE